MPASGDARLAAARPAVAIAGRDDPGLAEGLLSMRIHESADGQYSCEATVGNWGAKDGATTFLYFDRGLLDFGKALTISLGTDPLFQGRISALEAYFPDGGGPRLAVLAEDRHADLRTMRRSRTFADVTDADVIRQVATDHGLSADVSVPGPTYRLLAQLNQSDLAFLRDRARVVDAELWMDGNTLHARSRAGRLADAPAPPHFGYGHELREFTVLADLADQRTDVTVSGWDTGTKKAIAETAGEATVSGELAGGQGGSRILATALAQRAERVVHAVPLSGQEARSRAETLYRRIARRFVTGRGVADTSALLRVGAKVNLDHLGDLFSGEYYVSEVTHLFDGEQGLRTEFVAERAGLGGGGQ
jgi:phage protein D